MAEQAPDLLRGRETVLPSPGRRTREALGRLVRNRPAQIVGAIVATVALTLVATRIGNASTEHTSRGQGAVADAPSPRVTPPVESTNNVPAASPSEASPSSSKPPSIASDTRIRCAGFTTIFNAHRDGPPDILSWPNIDSGIASDYDVSNLVVFTAPTGAQAAWTAGVPSGRRGWWGIPGSNAAGDSPLIEALPYQGNAAYAMSSSMEQHSNLGGAVSVYVAPRRALGLPSRSEDSGTHRYLVEVADLLRDYPGASFVDPSYQCPGSIPTPAQTGFTHTETIGSTLVYNAGADGILHRTVLPVSDRPAYQAPCDAMFADDGKPFELCPVNWS